MRDQHREPWASFSCVQVEDRPELQGWSSSISCAEDGMFLLSLHPVHYCSAGGTVAPASWPLKMALELIIGNAFQRLVLVN